GNVGFLYGRLAGDCSAVAGLVSAAFNTPPDDAARWVVDSGIANVRVLSAGRAQIGCMLRVPMGQWFGGRSVPMVGIAGVAVAPHERGRGAALQMMRSAMAELAEEEVPLST